MKAKNGIALRRLYLGVDVGGTKIQASLVEESGTIRHRQRVPTPREGGCEAVLAAIEGAVTAVVEREGARLERITALGIAVPGVVDPKAGYVVVTPNMSLGETPIRQRLEDRFRLPVALGNDCNLGALGEKWLGASRGAGSAMSILVGTGIGGGFVRKGKLWRGAREAAGEIGHIVMQIGGPQCGCGNRGCLEALASRSAIERDIRAAIAAGRASHLTELCGGDLSVIRSGALARALAAGDAVVTEIIRRAAEVLGHACLTVRHLLDPEVIVLGGGVIEACGDFMVPIVESILSADRLPGARDGGWLLLSSLGDDAVVLGCVALARRLAGRDPFKKRFAVQPNYPRIARTAVGEIVVGEKSYSRDVCISAYGEVKKLDKDDRNAAVETPEPIGPQEVARACRGGARSAVHRRGRQGAARLGRRSAALSGPARHPLRNPLHARRRGGLQQVETAQGGADASQRMRLAADRPGAASGCNPISPASGAPRRRPRPALRCWGHRPSPAAPLA